MKKKPTIVRVEDLRREYRRSGWKDWLAFIARCVNDDKITANLALNAMRYERERA